MGKRKQGGVSDDLVRKLNARLGKKAGPGEFAVDALKAVASPSNWVKGIQTLVNSPVSPTKLPGQAMEFDRSLDDNLTSNLLGVPYDDMRSMRRMMSAYKIPLSDSLGGLWLRPNNRAMNVVGGLVSDLPPADNIEYTFGAAPSKEEISAAVQARHKRLGTEPQSEKNSGKVIGSVLLGLLALGAGTYAYDRYKVAQMKKKKKRPDAMAELRRSLGNLDRTGQ